MATACAIAFVVFFLFVPVLRLTCWSCTSHSEAGCLGPASQSLSHSLFNVGETYDSPMTGFRWVTGSLPSPICTG